MEDHNQVDISQIMRDCMSFMENDSFISLMKDMRGIMETTSPTYTRSTPSKLMERESILDLLEVSREKSVTYINPEICSPFHWAMLIEETEDMRLILFLKYGCILSDPIEVIEFILNNEDDDADYTIRKDCAESSAHLLYYASTISAKAFEIVLGAVPIKALYGDFEINNFCVLSSIIQWGQKSLLKIAKQYGADLNYRDDYGSDLLSFAMDYPKMIPLLIKHGACFYPEGASRSDDIYEDPRFDHVVELGYDKYAELVKVFEECNVDIYKDLSTDENELYQWCRHAHGIKAFLLAQERGASINHLNNDNYTPLKYALEDPLLGRPDKLIPAELLVSIIAKMIENKEYVNEENKKCLEDERVREFYNSCKKELNRLKEKNIYQSISCYDFLTGNLRKLTALARYGKIKEQFRSQIKNKDEFPIYFAHLKRNFQRSIWRLKKMKKCFRIIGDYLPKLIVEEICGFLKDAELIKAQYYFTSIAEFLSKKD